MDAEVENISALYATSANLIAFVVLMLPTKEKHEIKKKNAS